MEAVLFTCCYRFSPPLLPPKGGPDKALYGPKYLGLWFDSKLTFKEHAKRPAAKAERIVASISWLMSNLGGLSEGKRKLLANFAM